MLLPHPPHPDAGASHPHPQFVAAKSLMLIPPELSLHFQYMHHGMSDFHSENEKVAVHSLQNQLQNEKFYMDRT